MELDREAGSAAAARDGVGILDLEGLAKEVVDEVNLRSRHVDEGEAVDQHLGIVLLDDGVVCLYAIGEIEFIGKARTAAAFDRHAQCAFAGLGTDDYSYSFCRSVGKGYTR